MAKKCDLCDKEKPLEVYICPGCKSHDVGYVFELGNLFGIIPNMKCRKCGYSAPVFPRLVVNRKKLNRVRKKSGRKKNDDA